MAKEVSKEKNKIIKKPADVPVECLHRNFLNIVTSLVWRVVLILLS